jgi:2-methylcitrate dehydratase PrpD
MARITVDVAPTTARKWKNSTPARRRKVGTVIGKVLEAEEQNKPLGHGRPSEKELVLHQRRVRKHLKQYEAFLNRLGEKAAAKGLTQEKLDALLKEIG